MLSIVSKKRTRPSKARRLAPRKYRRTAPLSSPILRGIGFPDQMIANIRYNDVYAVSGSGTGVGGQVMSLNNLHDPDVSGIGHQPTAYDQFAAIYQNFVVVGARIDVTFSSGSGGTNGPWVVGITGNSQNSFASTTSELIEQPRTVTTMLGRDVGSSVQSLSLYFTPKKCLGLSATDDTVAGNTNGTAPSKQFYARLWVSDRGAGSGTVACNVTVTYKVKFYNIKAIAQS